MGKFVKGDVVVLSFPFSDLSGSKKRPALVLSDLKGDDVILCQITSQNIFDDLAVKLETNDINGKGLNQLSNIRPNKLFTADKNIVHYKVGNLSGTIFNEVIKTVISIFIK